MPARFHRLRWLRDHLLPRSFSSRQPGNQADESVRAAPPQTLHRESRGQVSNLIVCERCRVFGLTTGGWWSFTVCRRRNAPVDCSER